MNKIIEYVIGAKDATGNAIKSALGRIRDFTARVGANLANVKVGFDMLATGVRKFVGIFTKSIAEAFRFEKAIANFKTLLGSIKESRKHIEDLRKFAAATPLTFDDVQGASKVLLSFGASVETVLPTIKMLGDIALGERSKFHGLALVFAQVKAAGKLMGQDLLQMINQGFNPLTIIAQKSNKSVGELKDMMAKGAITFEMVAEAMRVATSEGGLFNNAMKDAATTGEGLLSTLEDNWIDAVRTFGNELMDVAKGGIQWCINKLQELKESGAITEWAKKAKMAIYGVMGAFKGLSDSGTRTEAWSAIKDVVIGGFEVGSNAAINLFKKAAPVIGALIGQGFMTMKDLVENMLSESFAKANATQSVTERWKRNGRMSMQFKGLGIFGIGAFVDTPDNETEFWQEVKAETNAILEERKRQMAQEVKMRAEDMAGYYIDSPKGETRFDRGFRVLSGIGKRLQAEMSAVDKTPVTQTEKENTEYKKIGELKQMIDKAGAQEDEKTRLKIEATIARERERQRKEYAQRVKANAAAMQKQNTKAQMALNSATENERKAWGWYLDKDSLKGQLTEEQANAQAESNFEKEFAKLKSRRYDWRTANDYGSGGMHALSLDETAVKRVALAREEKEAAAKYAQQTAEAQQRAAKALETIHGHLADSE